MSHEERGSLLSIESIKLAAFLAFVQSLLLLLSIIFGENLVAISMKGDLWSNLGR
jgi:hypothetical protein